MLLAWRQRPSRSRHSYPCVSHRLPKRAFFPIFAQDKTGVSENRFLPLSFQFFFARRRVPFLSLSIFRPHSPPYYERILFPLFVDSTARTFLSPPFTSSFPLLSEGGGIKQVGSIPSQKEGDKDFRPPHTHIVPYKSTVQKRKRRVPHNISRAAWHRYRDCLQSSKR